MGFGKYYRFQILIYIYITKWRLSRFKNSAMAMACSHFGVFEL